MYKSNKIGELNSLKWHYTPRSTFRPYFNKIQRHQNSQNWNTLHIKANLPSTFLQSIQNVHVSEGDLLVHDIALNYTHYEELFCNLNWKKLQGKPLRYIHSPSSQSHISCSTYLVSVLENIDPCSIYTGHQPRPRGEVLMHLT